jgi:hypothetical protein
MIHHKSREGHYTADQPSIIDVQIFLSGTQSISLEVDVIEFG